MFQFGLAWRCRWPNLTRRVAAGSIPRVAAYAASRLSSPHDASEPAAVRAESRTACGSAAHRKDPWNCPGISGSGGATVLEDISVWGLRGGAGSGTSDAAGLRDPRLE
ncbi:hypothetical protein GCM10009854_12310 [Saccharopolyspora halophila]|uniref:Uncharacterized protein n=1 Tax=Saccharopolyspora halophila TaxID=405551 RepID=A0ABP5SW41_9PSEU